MLKTMFILGVASLLCNLSQQASANVMPVCNVKAAAVANERFPGQLGAGQTNDCTQIMKLDLQQNEYITWRCVLKSSLSPEPIVIVLSEDCGTVISAE